MVQLAFPLIVSAIILLSHRQMYPCPVPKNILRSPCCPTTSEDITPDQKQAPQHVSFYKIILHLTRGRSHELPRTTFSCNSRKLIIFISSEFRKNRRSTQLFDALRQSNDAVSIVRVSSPSKARSDLRRRGPESVSNSLWGVRLQSIRWRNLNRSAWRARSLSKVIGSDLLTC
jgi:hypothetical protein